MASDKVLGIDLGTTNSGMAVVEAGDPTMLQNNDGRRLTPSVVHYDGDGDALVGRQAIDREPGEPNQVIREIKRHMGESNYTEEVKGNEYTPPEVSAEILKKLKKDAETSLNEVEEAVITVPAYFTIDQTAATKEAAEIADFEEIHLLNEPTAAALAYGDGKDLNETLLVYDFGGGTLDISLIDVADDEYMVLATDGDNKLGGADIDRALMELLAERYEDENDIEILSNDECRANLRSEAEKAKKSLSSNDEVEILAPFLGQINGELVSMEEKVTRETFEEKVEDLLDRAIDPVDSALEKADLSTEDIDTILLVGGSTQIPAVQNQLEEHVGIKPTMTLDPDQIVAQGAAVYAQREVVESGYRCTICGKEFDDLRSMNEHYDERHDESEDEDVYECPYCEEEFDSERERQKHEGAEHRPKLSKQDDGITDIISSSLGTELSDGSMAVIIEQGTSTQDATGTDLFTTVRDNQTRVRVGVYQGENEIAEENREIGEVVLKDIPPRPKGIPQIEVTFDYDKDGILHVEAEDKESGDDVDGDFEL